MEKLYVFGHKKPDTDTIASAIATANLQNLLGNNAEAFKLGNISKETRFALDSFGMNEPQTLESLEENVNNYNNDSKYDSLNDGINISYSENECSLFNHQDLNSNTFLDDLEETLNENNNLKGFDPKILFSSSIKDDSTGTSTEESKFIHKKRDNDKNKEDQFKSVDIDNVNINKNIAENQQEEIKEEAKTKAKTDITQNTGRRNKKKKYEVDAKHTKSSEDNIMRKIKTRIVKDIFERLNNSVKNNSGKFFPLTPKINVNLKRDINLEFLDRTIADIYANTDLNERYIDKGDHNKKLIEKIFRENIETETIKILKMTFRDFLKEIREKYVEDFLNKIKTKEINNKMKKEKENEECIKENIDIDEDCDNEIYMDKVRSLLSGYENWFTEKKGRNTKKN